jgi:hypothetical protein
MSVFYPNRIEGVSEVDLSKLVRSLESVSYFSNVRQRISVLNRNCINRPIVLDRSFLSILLRDVYIYYRY